MIIDIKLDTTSNTALVTKNVSGVKKEFTVATSDLIDSFRLSKSNADDKKFKPIIGLIQQKKNGYELIQTIQIAKQGFIYIFKVDKKRVPFYIYDKCYGVCGMPSLLVAVKVVNKKFNGMYVQAIKENTIIENSSPLYIYPFSNTSCNTGSVCFGLNSFEQKLNSIEDIVRLIDYFYEIPNTSEMFRVLNNKPKLQFRELASTLKDEDFNDDFLVENSSVSNYEMWLSQILR